ncbi:MAG: protease inhibitor I42 family protein [Candidatus Eremiobacteraeota bacterium]|nr:protease inhibitor I42 family protein [Candidatus Eremiobacteraeota bacterium]
MRVFTYSFATLAVALALSTFAAPAEARKKSNDAQAQSICGTAGIAPSQVTVAPYVASSTHPNIAVSAGDVFLISLGVNPASGYHWEIAESNQPRPFATYGYTMREMGTPQYQQQYRQSQFQQYPQYQQPNGQYPQYQQQPQPYAQYPQQQAPSQAMEQLWIFRAVAPGTAQVTFRYVAPGMPANALGNTSLTFTIGVSQPGMLLGGC